MIFFKKLIMIKLMILMLFSLSHTFANIVWSEVGTFGIVNHQNYSPIVDVSANGSNVALMFVDDDTSYDYICSSNDFGQTWTYNVVSVDYALDYSLVFSDNGAYGYSTMTATIGAANSGIYLSKAINFSTTWSAIDVNKVISDSSSIATHSSIAINDTGSNVYVLWAQIVGGKYQTQTSRSTDYGATFPAGSSATKLSDASNSSNYNDITCSENGQYVYAAWHSYDGVSYIIQTSRSTDFGTSWTPISGVIDVSVNDGKDALNPAIKTSKSGQYVYIMWRKNKSGTTWELQISRSSDYGVTFTAPLDIVNTLTPIAINNLNFTIDPTGKYIYGMTILSTGDVLFFVSSDYGSSFSTDYLANTTTKYPVGITTNFAGNRVYGLYCLPSDFGVAVESYNFGTTQSLNTIGNYNYEAYYQNIATDKSGRFVYSLGEYASGGPTNWILLNIGIEENLVNIPKICPYRP
jgi:hypothetical protein